MSVRLPKPSQLQPQYCDLMPFTRTAALNAFFGTVVMPIVAGKGRYSRDAAHRMLQLRTLHLADRLNGRMAVFDGPDSLLRLKKFLDCPRVVFAAAVMSHLDVWQNTVLSRLLRPLGHFRHVHLTVALTAAVELDQQLYAGTHLERLKSSKRPNY